MSVEGRARLDDHLQHPFQPVDPILQSTNLGFHLCNIHAELRSERLYVQAYSGGMTKVARLPFVVAGLLLLGACGDDDEPEAQATTTEAPTTTVASPFAEDETEALLAILDDTDARSLMSDHDWLVLIGSTCEVLEDSITPNPSPETIELYADRVRAGDDGALVLQGLVETTKISCPTVGFALAVYE